MTILVILLAQILASYILCRLCLEKLSYPTRLRLSPYTSPRTFRYCFFNFNILLETLNAKRLILNSRLVSLVVLWACRGIILSWHVIRLVI
jgi:hypothetical protein